MVPAGRQECYNLLEKTGASTGLSMLNAKVSKKPIAKQTVFTGIQLRYAEVKGAEVKDAERSGTKLHRNKGVLDIWYWECQYRDSGIGHGLVNRHPKHERRHGYT